MTGILPPTLRILVIPLRFIGDTVVTLPLLHDLKAALPQSHLSVMTSPVAANVLETCPWVDDVWVEPPVKSAIIQTLHAGEYDSAIILRKSLSTALHCRSAGIPVRVGYDKQRLPLVGYRRTGLGLTLSVPYPRRVTDHHQVWHHRQLLRAMGLPTTNNPVAITLIPEDLQAVARWQNTVGISEAAPTVAIHLTSASHGKGINPEKVIPSLQWLHQQGLHVVATGTKADRALYTHLGEASGVPIALACGELSLRESAAVYQQAKLVLSVDSAPIHLAAGVVAKRIVGLFGPTNPVQWGPYNPACQFTPVLVPDLDCRPCYAKVCAHNRCKVDMSAGSILAAVQSAMNPG